MLKKWEVKLAMRYVFTSHKERFISVINIFALIGISLGVATLIVVMAVMNGYEVELLDKILGLKGHITLIEQKNNLQNIYRYQNRENNNEDHEKYHRNDGESNFPPSHSEKILKIDDGINEKRLDIAEKISQLKGISSASSFIEAQGVIMNDKGVSGAIIKGVTADYIWKKKLISSGMEKFPSEGEMPGIVLGIELAKKMKISLGDKVKIISPNGHNTLLGQSPRSVTLRVSGMVDMGIYEYNAGIAFMPIELARIMFKAQQEMIEVILSSPREVSFIKKQLLQEFPNFLAIDWQENNQGLVQALRVEQNVMFLILSLIIMIATFNIISSLVILVKDKSKTIAILRTMGATRASIIRIFVSAGAVIGVIGAVSGMVMGVVFVDNIQTVKEIVEKLSGNSVFDPMVYFLTKLPAKIVWEEVAKIVILSLSFSFLATIYPAVKVAKIDPAKTLRYD